jgi:hypothetical protein
MTIRLRCAGNTAYLFYQYFQVAPDLTCIPETLLSNLTALSNQVSECLRQKGILDSLMSKKLNDLLVCVENSLLCYESNYPTACIMCTTSS